MTQADSARALRMSLDSNPSAGKGQATALTPLPKGWGSFCSKPGSDETGRWYATAPWNVDALKTRFGAMADDLEQTVCADTWPALHKAVAVQVALHLRLIGGAE